MNTKTKQCIYLALFLVFTVLPFAGIQVFWAPILATLFLGYFLSSTLKGKSRFIWLGMAIALGVAGIALYMWSDPYSYDGNMLLFNYASMCLVASLLLLGHHYAFYFIDHTKLVVTFLLSYLLLAIVATSLGEFMYYDKSSIFWVLFGPASFPVYFGWFGLYSLSFYLSSLATFTVSAFCLRRGIPFLKVAGVMLIGLVWVVSGFVAGVMHALTYIG